MTTSFFTKLNILKPTDSLATAVNLLTLVLAVLLIYLHHRLPPLVPLWFSKPWGLLRLAPPNNLWLFPLLIFFVFLVNSIFSQIILREHKVLAKILVWSSVFTSLVLFYSLYRILILVV